MLSRSEKSKVMGVNNMKILIAEDNRDIALVYRVALQNRNHHVVITDNGEDCLTVYREELRNFISTMGCLGKNKRHVFDVVILDYRMPRINGIEVAKEIIRINPKQRIIIVSAYLRETILCSVKELGLGMPRSNPVWHPWPGTHRTYNSYLKVVP